MAPRAGAARKGLCIESASAKAHRTQFLTLFLIWRLHKKEAYGYALLREMDGMAVSAKKPSTIYAILGKLEKAGLVKSRLEPRGGRVRKIYQATRKGWALFEGIRRKRIRGMLREFIRALAG